MNSMMNELIFFEVVKGDTIFLRWERLYHWWEDYEKKHNKLWILLVRQIGRLIKVVPTYLKNNFYGSKKIHFLGSNEVGSDYLDLRVLKDYEELVVISIMAHFTQNFRLWS